MHWYWIFALVSDNGNTCARVYTSNIRVEIVIFVIHNIHVYMFITKTDVLLVV